VAVTDLNWKILLKVELDRESDPMIVYFRCQHVPGQTFQDLCLKTLSLLRFATQSESKAAFRPDTIPYGPREFSYDLPTNFDPFRGDGWLETHESTQDMNIF